MSEPGFGIIGTGLVAGVVATSIGESTQHARLAAVSSRKQATAENLAAQHGAAAAALFESLAQHDGVGLGHGDTSSAKC